LVERSVEAREALVRVQDAAACCELT
jgi:hypothetical protein